MIHFGKIFLYFGRISIIEFDFFKGALSFVSYSYLLRYRFVILEQVMKVLVQYVSRRCSRYHLCKEDRY